MLRRQYQKPTTTANLKNPDLLLLVIRSELGPDWGCYKELIEGAAAAKASGENVSAWVTQIEPLVQNSASRIAHGGVLFLLGVTVQSEDTSTTDATPSSALHNRLSQPPVQPSANMQHDFTLDWTPMTPSSFNGYMPTTPTSVASPKYPAPNIAFYGEKSSTTDQPLKSAYSGGFVLHQDPAFRRDVFEFFGHAWPDRPNSEHHDQGDVPSVYKAADDDLAVWKAGTGVEGEVKDSGKMDNIDRIKSAEDSRREHVLEGLRHKLFHDKA